MLWAGASLLSAYALAWVAYLGAGGCGFNGRYCPDACARVESHLRQHIVGQARRADGKRASKVLLCGSC